MIATFWNSVLTYYWGCYLDVNRCLPGKLLYRPQEPVHHPRYNPLPAPSCVAHALHLLYHVMLSPDHAQRNQPHLLDGIFPADPMPG